jgi:hypothetical protein
MERPKEPQGRLPRLTRLMALAIRFDGLLRAGLVSDQAQLARLGHVSRARMTQIMNLLYVAPDIQEHILFLPAVRSGREPRAPGPTATPHARVGLDQTAAALASATGAGGTIPRNIRQSP